jgi:hypothetical protein
MASLMRDWIAPVALKELSAAYDCFKLDYQAGQTLVKGQFGCSPDAVTVRLTKGRNIQIVDVSILAIEYMVKC